MTSNPGVGFLGFVAGLAASCGSAGAPTTNEESTRTSATPGEAPIEQASATAPELVPLEGVELFGVEVAGYALGPARDEGLLMLHGGRFSSETWRELGTLEAVSDLGVRVVAVDLPGFGGTPNVATDDRAEVLAALLDALGLERALVVAPSMSGCFLLPFAARHPERLLGIVPVAPACAEAPRGPLEVPALVLWGDEDTTFPVSGAAVLAASFHPATIEIFPGAGHPCYLDDPARFHALLRDFVIERVPALESRPPAPR